MLDEVPRFPDPLVGKGTVRAVLAHIPILVREHLVGSGAFKERQGAVAEEAVKLFRLDPLVAGEELTGGVGVPLEVLGLHHVFRLGH